jgi:integrase
MLKLVARRVKSADGEQKVWYIKGTCSYTGQYFRQSTRCHSKSDAEIVLTATIERQRQAALLGSSAGLATFSEAVVEYLAKGGEAQYLTPLVNEFGETPLRKIEDTDLSSGAAKAYPGAKASTLVRQWYGPFQSVWSAAARAKLVHERTWTKPKVKRIAIDYPTDDWLEKVITACTRLEQRATILFMSFSGLRTDEVVTVKCRHFDRAAGIVVVHKTKTDPRSVHLPPFIHEIMLKLPEGASDAPLFGYASRYSVTRILRRACKRAKITYFSPHKAGRHAFAARFLADGNSLKALMEAGGWKSVAAVMRYAHLEQKTVDAAVKNVSTPLAQMDLTGTLTGTVEPKSLADAPQKPEKDV